MLFVCIGICVLSPAHESEMRGHLCLSGDCKLLIDFLSVQPQYIRLDGLIVDLIFFFFRGVCGP